MSTQRSDRQRAGSVRVADMPKGPNGNPLCRWCGKETPGKRRTFCSEACVREHLTRTSPSHAREYVRQRDQGICAVCGADTAKAARIAHHASSGLIVDDDPEYYSRSIANKDGRDAKQLVRSAFGLKSNHYRTTWWDADHIVPVVEGGGSCGLDNLRTLCIPCHREETRKLRRRLSQKNKTTSINRQKE